MPTKTFTVTKQLMVSANTGHANPGDLHIPIGRWDPGTGLAWNGRAVLYAPINFSGMTAINEARLYLRAHAPLSGWHAKGTESAIIRLWRKTSDWSESSAGTSTSIDELWGGNGTSIVTSGFYASSRGEATLPNLTHNAWYAIDATELVRDWFNGSPNYGALLTNSTNEADPDKAKEFWSRHESGSSPYFWIDYSTNTAPNAPTGLSPSGSTTVHTLSPTFSGSFSDPDSGDSLSAVQIQVYNDAETSKIWDSGTLSDGGTSFSKSYGGPALTGNTFYKWRARTRDAAGVWGPYSTFQRFKVNSVPNAPTLSLSESPTSDIMTLTPTFRITHSDPDATDNKAHAYELELQTSGGSPIYDSGQVSITPVTTHVTTYSGPSLNWGTSYRWRARTRDSNGAWSSFTGWVTFTTHKTAKPVSLSPSGVTVGSLTPTFTGSRGDSDDSLTSAQIQVYENDGTTLVWDSGTFTGGVTSSSFSKQYSGATLAFATSYKWRARVTASAGGTSDWTALQTFTTPSADGINVTAPVGEGIADLTPQIEFSRTDSFNAYEIEVRRASDLQTMWDTGAVSIGSSVTSRSITYAGTALDWATTYEFRVRVSSDNGSTWGNGFTDWIPFTTDAAGAPVLTAPVDESWETTLTPTFTGNTVNGETISTFRIILYASDQQTVIWDSGDIAGSGTNFSKVYNGPTLTAGATYFWKARYVESTGAPGPYSPLESFHINASPNAPTNLEPVQGAVVADTLTPEFKATFSDDDRAAWGDTPTVYEVEVYRNSDSVLMHALSDNTDLDAGQNALQRTSEGTALSYEVEYKWRARYTDSKGAVGSWSSFNVFKPSQSPTATITAPGATVNSPSFTISWSFSSPGGKAQQAFQIVMRRDSDSVAIYDTGKTIGASSSFVFPAGFLVNATDYTIELTVWDADDLPSALVTQSITTNWAAPDAITGFSTTADTERSIIQLNWDITNLSDTDFSFYQIYRKLASESEWTPYARIDQKTTLHFEDFFAGNTISYQYKITVFKVVPGDVDIESPDSEIATTVLDSDEWFVIGADRSEAHSFELPVQSESHAQPVQEEVFEPLGSNRKVKVRGRVLGNEGTLELVFTNDEHALAQSQIDYIVNTVGPHILKSPFGDVWEVDFSGPSKKYTGAGHLQVSLSWIEVV